MGLSGVISPQSLIHGKSVHIDFKQNIARYAGKNTKICKLKHPEYSVKTLSLEGIIRPIISVFLDEQSAAIPFLIDTGASSTYMDLQFLENISKIDNHESQGMAGIKKQANVYGPITLLIGKAKVLLPKVVGESMPKKSKLGMDLLQNSTLILMKNGKIKLKFNPENSEKY